MELPLQITFRDIPHSDAVEAYVRKRAEKLASPAVRITACHVVIESPHKHHRHGRHFRVLVDVSVPGSEVVVSRSPDEDDSNEDIHAAIDEAFDRVNRRLDSYVRQKRDAKSGGARTPR
jgi:ribosomal subunit interface protein